MRTSAARNLRSMPSTLACRLRTRSKSSRKTAIVSASSSAATVAERRGSTATSAISPKLSPRHLEQLADVLIGYPLEQPPLHDDGLSRFAGAPPTTAVCVGTLTFGLSAGETTRRPALSTLDPCLETDDK